MEFEYGAAQLIQIWKLFKPIKIVFYAIEWVHFILLELTSSIET